VFSRRVTAFCRETDEVQVHRQPGFLVSLLWFVFIGSWAPFIWSVVAWVLLPPIVTVPLGLLMSNRLPKVARLRAERTLISVVTDEAGVLRLRPVTLPQQPFWVRALRFVLGGWWLSALWILAARSVISTAVGIPLARWMDARVPAIVALRRYELEVCRRLWRYAFQSPRWHDGRSGGGRQPARGRQSGQASWAELTAHCGLRRAALRQAASLDAVGTVASIVRGTQCTCSASGWLGTGDRSSGTRRSAPR
jgi:uncharacterized membrane protein YccF (DUF307 family)